MDGLSLLQIRYFYDTVRLKSVSQAAKFNCVTQSAVSQGIFKLEKLLKIQLLTHCRNKIKVTAKGEQFFQHCQTVIQSMKELEHAVFDASNEYFGQITFACSHSIAQSILNKVFQQFKAQAPQVYVKMLLGHTGIIKEWIKQGRVEFGLILDNDDLMMLDCETLYSGNFTVFQSIDRDESIPIDCIFPEPRAEIFTIKKYFHDRYKKELKTSLEVNSWEVIANLVEMDIGFGFFPDYLMLNPMRRQLIKPCHLDISPIPYQLMLALPKNEQLSRNGQLFSSIVRNIIHK